MKVVVKPGPDVGKQSYWMWCPGCDDAVRISESWEWNGDTEKPTFSPSLLTRGVDKFGHDRVCHSFIVDGVWQFLGDCTHDRAGERVPMVDVPEWLIG